MIIIIFAAFLLNNPFQDLLLKNTTAIATRLQQKCFSIIPMQSSNHATLESLVCGRNLTDGDLKENLTKTSLIHLFVISGSHMILLEEILSFLKFPVILRIIFLGLYSLFVGWQPPAVRALFSITLRQTVKKLDYHFPADLLVLKTGLFVLALYPSWWNSVSLVMSWSAALALCWSPLLKIKNKLLSLLISQITIFLFMIAPLWGLGTIHPLGILFNLFLSPLISYLLFPLAFLSVAIHPFLPYFDCAMSSFNNFLSAVAEPITLNHCKSFSVEWLWSWIFMWHIFYHFLRLQLYQGKDKSQCHLPP